MPARRDLPALDWSRTDRALSRETGIPRSTIRDERRRQGAPPTPGWARYDDCALLGQEPDRVVGQWLGRGQTAVSAARRRRGRTAWRFRGTIATAP